VPEHLDANAAGTRLHDLLIFAHGRG
jgi:hypothetical protein